MRRGGASCGVPIPSRIHRSRRALRRTLLALVLASPPLTAQAAPGRQFTFDNDALSIWLRSRERQDGNYTQGLRFSASVRSAPWWGAHLAPRLAPCTTATAGDSTCLATELAFGQLIFTPTKIDPPAPLPGDRPYVGWLFASATAHVLAPRRLRSLGLEVGVTGEPSLAEPVQRGFHALLGSHLSITGWRYQLGFRPGVRLTYAERWRAALHTPSGLVWADAIPDAMVELSNVTPGVRAGGELRAGYNLTAPWRAPAHAAPRYALYALVGAHDTWRAYDQFLDRSYAVADTTRRVTKLPWLEELSFGIGARARRVTIEFRGTMQGREYESQRREHPYGSLVVTVDSR